MFFVIMLLLFVGDIAWWMWAHARLKPLKHVRRWQIALGVFTACFLGYLVFFLLFPTFGRHAHHWVPTYVLASIYIWHVFVLPIAIVSIILFELISLGVRLANRLRTKKDDTSVAPAEGMRLTRRQALAGVLVAAPPLLLSGTVVHGFNQLGHFRINRMTVPLADLPADLDGLTIAHVSDIHVGRFTRPHMLPRIVEATNELKADLVAFTGDLIDLALADLPFGIDAMKRLDPRLGMVMIEGNHDLIEDQWDFEEGVKSAGLPLLLNECRAVQVRGKLIQFMGMSWHRRDDDIASSMSELMRQRIDEAFPILLSHHPHGFDAAVWAGIPLTLSGHTHGGQLMLNERLGAGPVMFRYWSGLYRKNNSALIVNNGVGNWFPLRLHAPAEIIHLTLRRASS